MHHEAAIIALKPFAVAVAAGGLSIGNHLLAQTNIGQTFEAIGIYGLPTVLVVYFIARDWYREREHANQLAKDKEELAKLTEADKQRSHELRITREREQTAMIATARAENHELKMAILEILKNGTADVSKITDSVAGKFVKQHSGKGGNSQ